MPYFYLNIIIFTGKPLHLCWITILRRRIQALTSFTQYQKQLFKYKLFIDELPMLTQLKQRQLDLYPSDFCVMYQSNAETQEHIWICSSYQILWSHILTSTALVLGRLLNNFKDALSLGDSEFHKIIYESKIYQTHLIWTRPRYYQS